MSTYYNVNGPCAICGKETSMPYCGDEKGARKAQIVCRECTATARKKA